MERRSGLLSIRLQCKIFNRERRWNGGRAGDTTIQSSSLVNEKKVQRKRRRNAKADLSGSGKRGN